MFTGYVTQEEAARLEGVSLDTLWKRMSRHPEGFETYRQSRENGGRPKVYVSVSSLSERAQGKYRHEQEKAMHEEQKEDYIQEEAPWYTRCTFEGFLHRHEKEYNDVVLNILPKIRAYAELPSKERGRRAAELAAELGLDEKSLYRKYHEYMVAKWYGDQKMHETGENWAVMYCGMALCRKPSENGKFPSLTEDMKKCIRSVNANSELRRNQPSDQMIYEAACKLWNHKDGQELPSQKTVSRYIAHLRKTVPGYQNMEYLACEGEREFRRNRMMKCKRDTTTLQVLELIEGDGHTFDLYVSVKDSNGKLRAIRPTLVAWMDVRSRKLVSYMMCEDANSQIIKESLVKLVYGPDGGTPKGMLVDNGKEYTAKSITGQNRKQRRIPLNLDGACQGFLEGLGVELITRALPYQGWSKGHIERAFRTVIERFSKWFDSYVGTLTGSKTNAKRDKDIQGMLERGELFTMEEFYNQFQHWVEEDEFGYHKRIHRGLKDAGETWPTPAELYANAPRYFKAAPPISYAVRLLRKADEAYVSSQGIQKFKTLYTAPELCNFVGKYVTVRWDTDNVQVLYVYDKDTGNPICEAESAEYLEMGERVSEEALTEHIRRQNKSIRLAREAERLESSQFDPNAGKAVAGKLSLTCKAVRPKKVVALPIDREYREEVKRGTNRDSGVNVLFARSAAAAFEEMYGKSN